MRFFLLILSVFLSFQCSLQEDEDSLQWEMAVIDSEVPREVVQDLPDSQWSSVALPHVPGFSQSGYWLRTELKDIDPDNYYLINTAPYVERVEFYYIQGQNVEFLEEGSTVIREGTKYKRFPYPIFKFNYDGKSNSWIYIKFTSESSIYIEPLVFDADALGDVYSELQVFHFLFFAILGFVLAFNLIQFFQTRNTTFLFYVFHILAVFLYQLAYTGLGKVYLWNDFPEWNRRSLVVLGSLSFFAISLFSIRFFQMERKSLKLYRILVGLLVVIAANGFAGFFLPISIIDPMTHTICSLTALILLGACIYVGIKGVGFIRFYLVAICLLIVSIIGFNLFAFGVLEWEWMRFSIEIGTFTEILVFNLAIRDKFSKPISENNSPATEESNNGISNSSNNTSSIEKSQNLDRTSNLDKASIYNRLDEFMEEKLFCDEDLSLDRLSSLLNIRTDQLSQLINQKYGQNFNQLINGFRIAYAKEILAQDSKRSILDIAFESGFNSKSTFHSEFRRIVGMTPSEFRKV